jgi:hypothetical protein
MTEVSKYTRGAISKVYIRPTKPRSPPGNRLEALKGNLAGFDVVDFH